jgi:outer membrane immunogenic protein
MRNSKFEILAVVATSLAIFNFAPAAYAADMPVKALAPAPPVATWTGFYVGLVGGYEWGTTRTDHGPNDPFFNAPIFVTNVTNNYNVNGALGGATAGYNWQAGVWVVGAEADYSAVFASGSGFGLAPLFTTTFAYGAKQRDLATFRGRFGYLAKPDLLIYATGGAALSNIAATNSNGAGTWISDPEYVWGWTAGAGVEWKFASHFSAKAEYLHVGFNDKSYFNPASTFAPPGAFLSDQHIRLHQDMVRVGINYQLF